MFDSASEPYLKSPSKLLTSITSKEEEENSSNYHQRLAQSFLNILPLSLFDDRLHIEFYHEEGSQNPVLPDLVVIRPSAKFYRKQGPENEIITSAMMMMQELLPFLNNTNNSSWRYRENDLLHDELDKHSLRTYSGFVCDCRHFLRGNCTSEIISILSDTASSCRRVGWINYEVYHVIAPENNDNHKVEEQEVYNFELYNIKTGTQGWGMINNIKSGHYASLSTRSFGLQNWIEMYGLINEGQTSEEYVLFHSATTSSSDEKNAGGENENIETKTKKTKKEPTSKKTAKKETKTKTVITATKKKEKHSKAASRKSKK